MRVPESIPQTTHKSLPIVCLMGATASGKTECAMGIADRLPVHLISVDSVMVFKGMDIGSGKPDATQLSCHPHALVNIKDPAEAWSAGDFVRLCQKEIATARHLGRIPLLVGGTMLYFHVLFNGLSPAPAVSHDLRLELKQRAETAGWPSLHSQLQQLDPVSANRIGSDDAKRLERALGVVLETGFSLTEWQRMQSPVINASDHPLLISLPHCRKTLDRRIEERLQHMLEKGFVEEVRRLHMRSDLHANTPSMQAIGYRQIWQWLDGKLKEQELEEKILIATRRHLRRQINWLKRFEVPLTVADSSEAATAITRLLQE